MIVVHRLHRLVRLAKVLNLEVTKEYPESRVQ
jgi:hypothetical protein